MSASEPVFLAPLRIEELAVRAGAPGADVRRIGMGPVHATATRSRLERQLAADQPIIVTGLGGGLERHMQPGLVVVASALQLVGQRDVHTLDGAERVAAALSDAGLRVRVAPVVSAPRMLVGSAQRDEAAALGAAAVDMESFWLAPLSAGRPFAVVRVIVDAPGREVRSAATPVAALRALGALRVASRALSTLYTSPLSPQAVREVGDL